MRLRYVEGAKELILAHPELIINNTENNKIDLVGLFKNDFPIHVEIGMGKGKFIYTLAKNNPDVNFIGIERFDSVIVRALYKVIENPLDNLKLVRMDAVDLSDIFAENSLSRIYLNFSDPWPKVRHAKRRLTHQNFLKVYEKLLIKKAELHFKTDNSDLFNFSVEELRNYPMRITYLTADLHHSDFVGNVTTEFEDKFVKQGNIIYKLTATFKEKNNG